MKLSTFSKKDFRKVALASAVVLGTFAASQSFAAAVNDVATSSATVVEPIAITKTQDMSFGEFSAGTGGTVVLTTASAASETGDVVLTGGAASAARFTVTGQTDASFSIGVTDNDLTHTDTTTIMTLATVHDLDGSTGDSPASGTLALGTQTLYVGGTLTVVANQLPGVYSGTVTATVNYN